MSEDSAEVQAMWGPHVKPAIPASPEPPLPELPAASLSEPAANTELRPASTETPNEAKPALPVLNAPIESPVVPAGAPAVVAPPVSVRPKPAAAGHASPSSPSNSRMTWLVVAAIVIIAGAIGTTTVWRERVGQRPNNPSPVTVTEGTATVVSRPAGAEVLLNGVSRGTTPLKMTLPVGSYDLELRNGASKRSLTLTVDAATSVREFVDLAPDGGRGSVDISTDVAGAHVTIDGVARGVTPLTVSDLEPGVHRVGMSNNGATVLRTVNVTAGATTAVVASMAPVGATGGWLTIQSPLELQVLEGTDVVGTSSASRLMLPAGRHELLLSAPAYDFQTSISTQIPAGRSVTVAVPVPNGTLSINAAPWADVTIDGRSVGSTPIGNLSIPVGPHDVVWRHPQLGERRQVVSVGARMPARASVDLTKVP